MLSQLKKIFFSFYKKPEQIEDISDIDKNVHNNYVSFYIDKNTKEPTIRTNIYDTSDEACQKYAEMLFNLNSGLYQQSIFDLLSGMSKQDEEIAAFITNVILNWMYISKDAELSYEQKQWNNNKPIISPTNFGKHDK